MGGVLRPLTGGSGYPLAERRSLRYRAGNPAQVPTMPASRKPTPAEVRAAWDAIEDNEPDISTERLAAMTADTLGIAADEVFDLLADDAA